MAVPPPKTSPPAPDATVERPSPPLARAEAHYPTPGPRGPPAGAPAKAAGRSDEKQEPQPHADAPPQS